MRRPVIAVALFFLALPCLARTAGMTPPIPIEIPMRDGAVLAADLYLPDEPEKLRFPVILVQTPYNKAYYAKKGLPLDTTAYAWVIVDWRGFWASKKAAVNGRKTYGKHDGFDTIEWIARQDWSNGRVGTWGASALGKIQFATAATRPPHLVCAVPVVATRATEYTTYYNGGVFRQEHASTLKLAGYQFIDAMKKAPTRSFIWKAAHKKPKAKNINIPMLIIGGWFDHCNDPDFGIVATYDELAETNNNIWLLMGPWTHSEAAEGLSDDALFPDAHGVAADEAIAFFDHFLRGVDAGWPQGPKARWYMMNAGDWRTSPSFPPDVRPLSIFPTADGSFTSALPEAPFSIAIKHDPDDPVPTSGGARLGVNLGGFKKAGSVDTASIEKHPGCFVLTTPPLKTTIDVAGSVRATVYVSAAAPSADIAIRLADVDQAGVSRLITETIRRVSISDDFERVKPLTPGEIRTVNISLPLTAFQVPENHQIRFILSCSNYPQYELNPAGATTLLLHSSPEHPFRIVLPLAKR